MISAIAMVSGVSATNVNAEVDAMAEMDGYDVSAQSHPTGMREINLTVENSGSVGCNYRIMANLRYGNTSRRRYSDPEPVLAGGIAKPDLFFVALNYTGNVSGSVYSSFCGQREHLRNLSFAVDSGQTRVPAVNSTTVSVDDDYVNVSVNMEEGYLVPRKTPPYWKAGSARVEDGEASISYDPPLFDTSESLEYVLVNGSGAVATTKVDLEVERTFLQRILDRLEASLAPLLGASLLLNVLLFFAARARRGN